MKIAIHHRKNSFSEYWIEYCKSNSISYKIVNAYDSDIINQLNDCTIFMWHHHHENYKDAIAAKNILFALEHAGKKVYPNFKTGWHFDDKVAQKYLLESINAPMIPSYVFYDKATAIEWAINTDFPKVFKLKGGAGASHVKLVDDVQKCIQFIKKAFGDGFNQYDKYGNLKERYRKYKKGNEGLMHVIKGIGRFFVPTDFSKNFHKEKSYIYFQDFIPNNKTDFRIKVVNQKCWGFQRKVRENDFRASGSGQLIFDKNQIPKEMIKIALEVAEKLNLQSVAFDFVMQDKQPLIVEISYGFGIDNEEFNHGYWTSDLTFHENVFSPFDWMIEELNKI